MQIEVLQRWIEALRKGVEKVENCHDCSGVEHVRAVLGEMQQTGQAQRHAAAAVPGVKLTATELLAFLTPEQHTVLVTATRHFVNDYLHRGGSLDELQLMTVKTYTQIQAMWDGQS